MQEDPSTNTPDTSPQNPTSPDASPPPPPETPPFKASSKRKWVIVSLLAVVILVGATAWFLGRHSAQSTATKTPNSQVKAEPNRPDTVAGLRLDTTKNYGNKYANGLLPVGDGKYSTTEAKQGSVYACSQYAQSLSAGQGGAGVRGPWFTNNNTQYDLNKKAHVAGSVTWQSSESITQSGGNRLITTNDLPNHATGIFPIAANDPAYAYDKNPNSIKSQSLSYTLPVNPVYSSPHCMGGEAGIMLTGVALFNGFDAGGRDAGAWEVQDSCSGHPQRSGEYHYHTLSSCITDTNVSTVIGYALDGYPITGPKLGPNNILTTADLDECHGIVSKITLDATQITTYHYVMTQDFPYSVSCFRAQPVQTTPTDAPPSQPGGPNQHP